MREIKFEYGFNSVNRIVKKVYHLHELPSISKKCDVWNDLPIAYVRQFTGLKDINKKDIYEGDLLKPRTSLSGNYVYEVRFENLSFVLYVMYNKKHLGNGRWGLLSRIQDHDMKFFKGFVVIGNIYENPELTEEQTK